jgi:hypothetical protein
MSNTTDKTEIKTVKGPKAAVAGFIRSDGQRIWVYPKTGESVETAIQRVMSRNGMKGGSYDRCN